MPTKVAVKVTKKAAMAAGPGDGFMLHGVALSHGDMKKAAAKKCGVVTELPRNAIKIQKGFNPRSLMGDVDSLAESIQRDGLINPVTVRPDAGSLGTFLLVAGERRLRAMDKLKWEKIPCSLRMDLEGDDLQAQAVSVAENSEDGRQNLNFIEIGRVCKRLMDAKWSVQRIATETLMHPQKVRRAVALMEAPTDVQKRVESGELSYMAGLELAHAEADVRKKVAAALEPGTSAAEVKRLVKQAANKGGDVAPSTGSAKHLKGKARDAALITWQAAKAKQGVIRRICAMIDGASEDEKQYASFHNLRGAAAYAMWDRGSFPDPFAPSLAPEEEEDPKAAKALLTKFDTIVKNEAKKFKPDGEGDEADTEEDKD